MGKRTSKTKVSLPKVSAQNTMRLDGDGPTPERLAKLPGVTIVRKQSGRKVAAFGPGAHKPLGADGVVRIDEPLDRLARGGRLDPDPGRNRDLHDAGDRLRQHWYRGTLGDAIGSVDLNRTGGGSGHPAWLTPSCEDVAYHRMRFRQARETMELGHWRVVFAIVCGEATLEAAGREAGYGNLNGATAVALDRLRRGLELLAELWGILRPRPADDAAASKGRRVATKVVRGDEVDDIIDRMVVANSTAAMRQTG